MLVKSLLKNSKLAKTKNNRAPTKANPEVKKTASNKTSLLTSQARASLQIKKVPSKKAMHRNKPKEDIEKELMDTKTGNISLNIPDLKSFDECCYTRS